MSDPQSKNNTRIQLVCVILIGILICPFIAFGQTKLDSIRFGKRIYISYGGVFTGNGDMWGQKLYLGVDHMLTKKLGIDLNMAGSLIDHVYYENNNPDWSRNEISNGLEFSANGLLVLGKKKVRFSSTLGPTIRYSYEHQSLSYGWHYNLIRGEYDWHCEYFEKQGFMFGGNLSFTLDFRMFKLFYIGPKVSMSYFPFDAYRFSYIGLNLTWK